MKTAELQIKLTKEGAYSWVATLDIGEVHGVGVGDRIPVALRKLADSLERSILEVADLEWEKMSQ